MLYYVMLYIQILNFLVKIRLRVATGDFGNVNKTWKRMDYSKFGIFLCDFRRQIDMVQ